MIPLYSNLVPQSVSVVAKRVPGLAELVADRAVVAGGEQMVGLHVVPHVSRVHRGVPAHGALPAGAWAPPLPHVFVKDL